MNQRDSADGSSVSIDGLPIIVDNGWVRLAAVHDEDWLPGQVVAEPGRFLAELKSKKSHLKADIFTFAQKIPDCKPRYAFDMKWDNMAAIPITSYEEWLGNVSTDMRKDLKRAEKRGIVVRELEFSDEIVRGIVDINNDTPIRQNKRFVHFGKDFDTVKREYSTYLERSAFIGAYHNAELVGIIKMVYVGELACLMEILSKTMHYDKRPTNALIAKAVEICVRQQKKYLTYGKYHYHNKEKSPFVDFKHRNGFERIRFPRYYIPLTTKGRLAVRFKLELGLLDILPPILISWLLTIRSYLNERVLKRGNWIGEEKSSIGVPPSTAEPTREIRNGVGGDHLSF